ATQPSPRRSPRPPAASAPYHGRVDGPSIKLTLFDALRKFRVAAPSKDSCLPDPVIAADTAPHPADQLGEMVHLGLAPFCDLRITGYTVFMQKFLKFRSGSLDFLQIIGLGCDFNPCRFRYPGRFCGGFRCGLFITSRAASGLCACIYVV